MSYEAATEAAKVTNKKQIGTMAKYHFHDGLTREKMEHMVVYCLTIKYNALYGRRFEPETTHIHYFDSPNGGILVELMQVMIYQNQYIESIEITKV